MPISTYPSFVGHKKETTPGTAVVVDSFTPATSIVTEDVKNYTPDTSYRGSAVDSYNQVPTQGWGTFAYECPLYMDVVGTPLKGILGAEDLSGAGPYVHVISTLNTGTYQAPTYTIVDYNGVEGRSFPYGVFNSLGLNYDPTGLVTCSVAGMAFGSSPVSKPSQSFSNKTAVAAYKTVVTVGGSATTKIEQASLTIARPTNPITAINNSTSPTAIWGGPVSISGSLTAIFEDNTFLTPMLNGTPTSVQLTTTNGADILDVKCTSGLFTAAPITRSGNGWMEITVAFVGVANTTDANTAGTGYSPGKVTLTDTTSTAF